MFDKTNEQHLNRLNQIIETEKTTKEYGYWKRTAEEANKEFEENISWETWRGRYKKFVMPRIITGDVKTFKHTKKVDGEGNIEDTKVLKLSEKETSNPRWLLKALGYDANFFKLAWYQCSDYEMQAKGGGVLPLTAVKHRVEPLVVPEFNAKDFLLEVKDLLKTAPKGFTFDTKPKVLNGLDKDKMLLEVPIELHLGKLSWEGDTGVNYDSKIASANFRAITQGIIDKQQLQKCHKLVMCIGSDFFNSDTPDNTTTKGTPQQNDVRWKKMFRLGVDLYKEHIEELEKHFNEIEIRCIPGNHDRITSYYLYALLEARYEDRKKLTFGKHTREMQDIKHGQCGIWVHHGDVNLKRTLESIGSEFRDLYGTTMFHDTHLNHLHHKGKMIAEQGGMNVHLDSSPSYMDYYHYSQRFFGAIPRWTGYIYDKKKGPMSEFNINFVPKKENKVLTKGQ